jgi:hypothetical protein
MNDKKKYRFDFQEQISKILDCDEQVWKKYQTNSEEERKVNFASGYKDSRGTAHFY